MFNPAKYVDPLLISLCENKFEENNIKFLENSLEAVFEVISDILIMFAQSSVSFFH